jgi:hypothetical protein
MLATFSKNVDQNYWQHYIKKVRNDSKNVGNISKKMLAIFPKKILRKNAVKNVGNIFENC